MPRRAPNVPNAAERVGKRGQSAPHPKSTKVPLTALSGTRGQKRNPAEPRLKSVRSPDRRRSRPPRKELSTRYFASDFTATRWGCPRSKVCDTKAEARAYVEEIGHAARHREWIAPERGRMLLTEWVAMYMSTVVHLRPTTVCLSHGNGHREGARHSFAVARLGGWSEVYQITGRNYEDRASALQASTSWRQPRSSTRRIS